MYQQEGGRHVTRHVALGSHNRNGKDGVMGFEEDALLATALAMILAWEDLQGGTGDGDSVCLCGANLVGNVVGTLLVG